MGGKAWQTVKNIGGAAVGKVKGWATSAFHHAKRFGGQAWNLAKGVASKLSVSNLCKAVGAVVGKAIAAVTPAVKAAWNGAKRLGAKAWQGAKAAGRAIAATATRWAGKAKQFATRAVSSAFRTVKGVASKAWNTAKSLGTKAFNGAKQMATAGWNTAKRLGTSAFNKAKDLGGKVLSKAKDLGSKIGQTAQAAGRTLLGIADKLTGGAASKVAGLANKILGKAAGLLSWVVNTAKSLASKAINTAKSLGAKTLGAARSAAAKAWQTAQQAVSKGLETARNLGTKAWNTAKSLGTRAFNTAKSLGARAVSTAKSWAGKAVSTAKSWGGKAWGAIKTGAGKVWDATRNAAATVWGTAKSLGRGALKVAKAVGLDKAWNTAKSLGGKALGAVKRGAAALKKRFQPVLDVVGKGAELLSKAAPAILSAPAFLACKVLGCATPPLVNKGSQTTQEAADIATDVVPGVSTVKDTCRCLTGENIVTGEDEGVGGRIMGCIWAAVDIASIIVGIVTAGTGTAAIQAIKTAARAGLRGMIKAIGKLGFRRLVDLAVDLVKRAWKKITRKAGREGAETVVSAGGHRVTVTHAGKVIVCSVCTDIRKRFEEILSRNRMYDRRLQQIEEMAANPGSRKRAARLAAELRDELDKLESLGRKLDGKSAGEAFGETGFRGLSANRPLQSLTDAELRAAFRNTPYTPSSHVLMRLRDPRTRNLGIQTLRDLATLLNRGIVEYVPGGVVTITRGNFKMVVNPQTKILISLVPA